MDDSEPFLPKETREILMEFYRAQENKRRLGKDFQQVEENWQLSQFWYDEDTIDMLIEIASKCIGSAGKIALVSCPSLYKKLKQALHDCEVTVFEYDKRFAMFGEDFVFYDYNAPLDVPETRKTYYDLVIADPPFLSKECLTKTSETIKYLSNGEKVILCTGVVMAELAEELLNVKKTSFEPKHANNLANEFVCYTNFSFDELGIRIN